MDLSLPSSKFHKKYQNGNPIYNYFTLKDPKRCYAQCIECGKDYSRGISSRNTTNLRNHLQRKHPLLFAMLLHECEQQKQSEGIESECDDSAEEFVDADEGIEAPHDSVYVRATEKLNAIVSRFGVTEYADILGNVAIKLTESEFNTVSLKMKCQQVPGTQIQVHPKMDKAIWESENRLKLKSVQKPYLLNSGISLIKWRKVLSDEDKLPLTLNVFPSESADGCTVNIEYTLQNTDLQLSDVSIVIPLPTATQPIVSEVYGSYDYVRSKSQLVWTIPIIDSSSESGTLEFSVPNGQSDHFFPVHISFSSENLMCGIEVEDVTDFDGESSVKHTLHSGIVVDKYDIV